MTFVIKKASDDTKELKDINSLEELITFSKEVNEDLMICTIKRYDDFYDEYPCITIVDSWLD